MKLLPLVLMMSMLSAAPASAQVTAYVRGNGGLVGQGRLENGDLVSDTGGVYDIWEFTAAAGDEVKISVASSDFDTFLGVFTEAGLIGTNDDDIDMIGTGATNSAFTLKVLTGGKFSVAVSSHNPYVGGAYTLQISDYTQTPSDYSTASDINRAISDLYLTTYGIRAATDLMLGNY